MAPRAFDYRFLYAVAQKYRKDAHRMLMTIPASKKYLNPTVVSWLNEVEERLVQKTGSMIMSEKIASKLLPAALAYTAYKVDNDIGQQPQYSRRIYRMSPQTQDRPSFALFPRWMKKAFNV